MEKFQISENQDSFQAFQKYLEQMKHRQQKEVSELNQFRKEQKIKIDIIDKELFYLQNQPVLIDSYQMKQILGSIDRLRTLKFLTQMYGGLKNDMIKGLDENLTNAFQETIDADETLRTKHQKISKIKKEQSEDIREKMLYNEQVMKQFVNREQMMEKRGQNVATQYELPQDEKMNLEIQDLLDRQANQEIIDEIQELQQKIDMQTSSKNQTNEEMNQIKRRIHKIIKENTQLENELKQNLLLLEFDLKDKDEAQKMQYAMILQNKITAISSNNPQSAFTHNLDLITILNQRINDQNLQILRLTELLKGLADRFGISLNIKELDFNEIDSQLEQFNPAPKAVKSDVKKSSQKVKKIQINVNAPKSPVHHTPEKKQQNITPEKDSPSQSPKSRAKLQRKEINQKKNKFMNILKQTKFNALSTQDQINIILSNNMLSDEDKQGLLKEQIEIQIIFTFYFNLIKFYYLHFLLAFKQLLKISYLSLKIFQTYIYYSKLINIIKIIIFNYINLIFFKFILRIVFIKKIKFFNQSMFSCIFIIIFKIKIFPYNFLICRLYNMKRGFLTKADQAILLKLASMSAEEFAIAKEQIVKLEDRRVNLKDCIFKKLPGVKKMDVKSKFMNMPQSYVVQTKTLKFETEVNKYLSDWRLKEFILIKGIPFEQRQQYLNQSKMFFEDMQLQLHLFEFELMKKAQEEIAREQEDIMKNVKQEGQKENNLNNLKFIQQSLGVSIQIFKSKFGKLQDKSQRNRILKENNQNTKYDQSMMTPYQVFYNELQSHKKIRKNTNNYQNHQESAF